MKNLKKIAMLVAGLFSIALLAATIFVVWALTTFDSRMQFPDVPRPDLKAVTDPVVIARGKYLVHGPAHCSQCHSGADRDHPELVHTTPLHGGLEFAMGPIATTYGRNLTPDPETGIGKISDGDLARTLRTGVDHKGTLSFFMTAAASKPSDDDIVAIISYLRSLAPLQKQIATGEWKPFGKILMSTTKLGPSREPAPAVAPPAETVSIERGKYLAKNIMLCSGCHTPFDMGSFASVGPEASGSLPDPSHGKDEGMEFVAPNLTSDPSGITGKWSEDQFVLRLKKGRAYPSSIMPWEGFQATTETDLRSVYQYLKSLPPIKNDLGPSYRKVGWKPQS
ncbi:MAG: cytochrome C [Bdellovibrionota bacterium]